jgi:hypothetical protein
LVRISCVVAFLVYFLIAVTTQTTGVSHLSHFGGLVSGRGLHSSTCRLNVSAVCGIGGTLRGCLGGVEEISGGISGVLGGVCGVFDVQNGSG